jgi:hypothetical protein
MTFKFTDKPRDKTYTTWDVTFKLKRANHLKYEFDDKTIADTSWFDKKHMKDEISILDEKWMTSMVEDLDYTVTDIKIKKCLKKKQDK